MKAKVYIETTIPSYLVARPSRDLLIAAHQQVTREWWQWRGPAFELYVSQPVLEEAAAGDATFARERLELRVPADLELPPHSERRNSAGGSPGGEPARV